MLHRGAGVRDFSLGAARILARAVPFDGVCVLTMDPATLLPTGEVVENGVPPAATPRLAEIELRGEDFNPFRVLVGSGRRAATLSEATGGDLDRSLRHRELKGPLGFGDELRAVLAGDAATGAASRCCAPPAGATSRRPRRTSSRPCPGTSPRACAARCC